ncbi:MAG: CoA protein activase, partial [Peptococcaceae bacterium]|nr:CoA protein activase [Peptococcaceae bacterium]
ARPRLGNPGETEKIYLEAQRRLAAAMSVAAVRETVAWTRDTIRERIAGKERREKERAGLIRKAPLRIGVIGEIYTILDPFSSLDMEKSLGYMGVEVDRSLYLSGWVGKHILQGWRQGYRPLKQYEKLARPYLPHFVGGHGQETVGAAVEFARRRVDGVIHLLPLNCMPEIVAAAILPQIQRDYGIPMMTLTVDEHTGRAGFQTRLEAFADLAQLAREDRTAVLNRREEAMCVAGK